MRTRSFFAALALVVGACSGEPAAPIINPPPPPTPDSLAVSVDQPSFMKGSVVQVHVMEWFSDHTSKDVTGTAALSSSPSSVVSVSQSGQATGLAPGNATITATLDGLSSVVGVTVVAPPVVVVSVAVLLQSPITVPAVVQFQAIAKSSDSTLKDVSSLATWSSSDPTVASMSSTGVFSALKAGMTTVTATYAGHSGSQTITILPPPAGDGTTPWSELPPISKEAKQYLIDGGIERFGNTRWNQAVISVWAQSGFLREDLQAALDAWQTALNGKITFVIAEDSASANVVFVFDSTFVDPNHCGVEDPQFINNGVVPHGLGRYSTLPSCQGDALYKKMLLAHGLGHILVLNHTAPGTDIMSSPDMRWVWSSLIVEVINWKYSVPPGTKPK